jgi:ankyrin repeat protein
MTPLHLAAAHGHFECVEYLLEKKGRVTAKDKFKRTPLILAVRNGNLKIASLLLQRLAI